MSITRRDRQAGMTITELMVASLVSIILIGGVIQIFLSSKATYRVQEGLSRIQENGRFGMDIMARELRMAGYMGCLATTTVHNNLNNASSFAYNFDVGIEGYEAVDTAPGDNFALTATNPGASASAADWSPALPSALLGQAIAGSDVVVVRYVNPQATPLVSPFNNSAQIFVAQPNDLVTDEILVITDCVKSSVFQTTNVTDVGGGATNVVHSASGTPGNSQPVWPIPEQQYGEGAEITRAETYAFYIAPGASGGPALFQTRLTQSGGTVAEELIEGVESMQIVYGEDTNEDRQIDAYVTADAVTDWDGVLSVRLTLLLRTVENIQVEVNENTYTVNGTTINPVDDQRQRRVFSTTVAIRNRAP